MLRFVFDIANNPELFLDNISFTTSFTLWTWNLWPCLSWNFCLIKLTIQSYSSTIFYTPIGCYSDSLPDYHNKSCWSTKFHLKICMIQYIVFPELNLLIKCLFSKGIFFKFFFFLFDLMPCVCYFPQNEVWCWLHTLHTNWWSWFYRWMFFLPSNLRGNKPWYRNTQH